MLPPLKPFQREALQALARTNHTILIAPTGSGKSLIFQKYIYDRKKTRALLISPLRALAFQHQTHFEKLKIPTFMGPPDGPGVCISSPEKLFGVNRSAIQYWKPNFVIVDEAHSVWEWGRAFRPEFALIPRWICEQGIQKTFWCSATLPERTLRPILSELPESDSKKLLGRFALPETLQIEKIRSPTHTRLQLLHALVKKDSDASGMIFVSTRKGSERIQFYLKEWGVDSIFYHAGMSSEERTNLEKRLHEQKSASTPIWVVATSAFGMGMDFSFLKTCILFEPPMSLLGAAQALGRVGRAGREAKAYVLWCDDDFKRNSWIAEQSPEDTRLFDEVFSWCISLESSRHFLENYFNMGVHESPERSQSID